MVKKYGIKKKAFRNWKAFCFCAERKIILQVFFNPIKVFQQFLSDS